jgi:xylan 1,4-beta-xylosidase
MKKYLILSAFIIFSLSTNSFAQQKTYCNPVNIDYGYTPIPNFAEWGKHRATADPVIVNYKDDFYLFSTNQWGYWWSHDMLNWTFNSKKFLRPWNGGVYDELCAPAVGIIGDTMLVFGSTYTDKFTIWMSTDPKGNVWKPLVDSFAIGGWDPAFFTDDNGRFYMFNGSSNKFPTYGVELNRKTMQPLGTRKEIYLLESWRYGWQRFGEYMDDTFLDPFIEGSEMVKHNGKYYYQYGAPGTEFSGYADGVIVGETPLGPFTAQSDPLSFKAGGFARGAGHGSTFTDNNKNYWHVSTISISVKNNFERRIGIWPAGFDKDDVMYCNTSFGDYPASYSVCKYRCRKCTGRKRRLYRLDAAQLQKAGDRFLYTKRLQCKQCGRRKHQDILERRNRGQRRMDSIRPWQCFCCECGADQLC